MFNLYLISFPSSGFYILFFDSIRQGGGKKVPGISKKMYYLPSTFFIPCSTFDILKYIPNTVLVKIFG
jgi:hypothetical protein